MLYDLHCHSRYSDGALSPDEIVLRAHGAGVTALALTDHDSIAGLHEAQAAAQGRLHLIPGVEISAGWMGKEIHIVGLQIDFQSAVLRDALAAQAERRWQRLTAMAEKLAKENIPNVEATLKSAFPGALPGRSHVAQILVTLGKAKDQERAFSRYIGRKGSAYVAATWPDVATVAGWIVNAGGLPVIAHPGRYQLSGNKLSELCRLFADAGGIGIELSYPQLFLKEAQRMAKIARQFGLFASQGSDFHSPAQRWTCLGRMPPLPPDVTPIWQHPSWQAPAD
jgi:hypothetical protein